MISIQEQCTWIILSVQGSIFRLKATSVIFSRWLIFIFFWFNPQRSLLQQRQLGESLQDRGGVAQSSAEHLGGQRVQGAVVRVHWGESNWLDQPNPTANLLMNLFRLFRYPLTHRPTGWAEMDVAGWIQWQCRCLPPMPASMWPSHRWETACLVSHWDVTLAFVFPSDKACFLFPISLSPSDFPSLLQPIPLNHRLFPAHRARGHREEPGAAPHHASKLLYYLPQSMLCKNNAYFQYNVAYF